MEVTKQRAAIRKRLIEEINAAIERAVGEADQFGELRVDLSVLKSNVGRHALRELAEAWPEPEQQTRTVKQKKRMKWM